MAIATRVISYALMAAPIALLNMSAQGCGTTTLDGAHDLTLLWRQRVCKSEVVPVLAEDVGHLNGGRILRSGQRQLDKPELQVD